jgi:hypothetical protein
METSGDNIQSSEQEQKQILANQAKNIILHTVSHYFPNEIPQGDIFALKPPALEGARGRKLSIFSLADTPHGKVGVDISTDWENTDKEFSMASVQITKLSADELETLGNPDREKAIEALRLKLIGKFMNDDSADNVTVIWNQGRPARVFTQLDDQKSAQSFLEMVDQSLPTMENGKKSFGYIAPFRQ